MKPSSGPSSAVPAWGAPDTPRPAEPGLTWLTLSFALGLATADLLEHPVLWPWILLGCAPLVAVLGRKVLPARTSMTLILLAAGGWGGAWMIVRQHYLAPNDLAALIDDDARLVNVRGVALDAPTRRDRTRGSMARFDYHAASMSFPMRVETLVDRFGTSHSVRGRVYVSVAETVAPFSAGDRVQVQGMLRAPGSPQNPGEFDYARLARGRGDAGMLLVPRRELVRVERHRDPGPGAWWRRWHSELRRRASAWLLSDLPADEFGERDALLASLLLGQRELHWEGVSASFRRVGLAHLLAISGLHLGVLAGFVLLVMRLSGAAPRWHGVAAILVVLGYLLLVEVRLPVLRAGVMTVVASLALVLGRRVKVQGLVALSALGLLLWRPDQIREPGFQLSFGVVLGILHFAAPMRVRIFGRPDQAAESIARMIIEWIKTAFAVTATAWMIAMPLTAFHFGVITPVAIPLSVVALPLVAMLLALGFLKIVLALMLPSAAYLLGVPLAVGASTLLSLIQAIDGLPGSSVHVPQPSVAWTVAMLIWVMVGATTPRYHRRWRMVWVTLAVLMAWLFWPLGPGRSVGPLRIDMLSVGDGTCIVIRSGGRAALFDAGSSTNLDAGSRIIVPALRRLGVRHLEFIAISHANLDHYSSVLEVADEFSVEEVLVTPQFLDHAARDEQAAAAYLLDELTRRFIGVRTIAGGETRTLGDATLTWLHPESDARIESPNDSSMVIRIEAAGRAALLCGDIQRDAILELLAARVAGRVTLDADILEMPHHGSFNAAALELVQIVDPSVLMQSTGPRRFSQDRWADLIGSRQRLVTARDGACAVTVAADGDISTDRFRPPERPPAPPGPIR